MSYPIQPILANTEALLKLRHDETLTSTTPQRLHDCLGQAVMMAVNKNWTQSKKNREGHRKAYYFSAEYLMGRLVYSNLFNMGILEPIRKAFAEKGVDLAELEDIDQFGSVRTALGQRQQLGGLAHVAKAGPEREQHANERGGEQRGGGQPGAHHTTYARGLAAAVPGAHYRREAVREAHGEDHEEHEHGVNEAGGGQLLHAVVAHHERVGEAEHYVAHLPYHDGQAEPCERRVVPRNCGVCHCGVQRYEEITSFELRITNCRLRRLRVFEF